MRLLSITLFAFFLASLAQAAPTSYPMKCRGSADRDLQFEFSATIARMGFVKAPNAAPSGLRPGECAWMDRAINAAEPKAIQQHPLLPKTVFKTTIRYGHLAVGTAHVYPIIEDPEINWMLDLWNSSDSYWLFMVYNDGAGRFIVTGAQKTTP